MYIAILEDDAAFASELAQRILDMDELAVYTPETRIFSNGESLLADPTDFDLILIDYQLGGSMNGMEAARRIRKNHSLVRIVFVTAYPEYVFESFKVNAFRYLVKPVSDPDLRDAVLSGVSDDYQNRVLVITLKKKTECIRLKTLRYIEANGRESLIDCEDCQLQTMRSISELEEMISDYHFCRISRSFVINFDYMKDFTNSYVIMKDGKKITIGRTRMEHFKKRYIQYLKNRN